MCSLEWLGRLKCRATGLDASLFLISLTILKNTCLFAAFPYIRVQQTAAKIWSKDSFFKSAPLIPMASTNAFLIFLFTLCHICIKYDYIYALLTKREVKMAGYWPSFFFFLWTETKWKSIKKTARPVCRSSRAFGVCT